MSGKYSMRPNAGSRASTVNIRKHLWASSMYDATRIGWVMHGDDHSPSVVLAFDAFQCCGQKRNLAVIKRICSALARDYAWIFQHVAVEPQDAHEWGIESEINPRLNHRRAHQRSGVWGRRRTGGTEVSQKCIECRCWIFRVDHAVVIASYCDNGRWVIPKWLVELIVVVRSFAKIIDNVSEMKEEGRYIGAIGLIEV